LGKNTWRYFKIETIGRCVTSYLLSGLLSLRGFVMSDDILLKPEPIEKEDVKKDKSYPYYNTWQTGSDTLQLAHMTREERFPLIFDSAKKFRPDAKRVLSFGCSTGEECQALAKRFPNAEIVGVDIDHYSILTARKRNKNPNIFFQDDLGATGSYDVVLALMVFFMMEKPIEYDKFAKILRQVHRHVNPGGVLMVYTSDHDPASIPEIAQYTPLNVWKRIHNKNNKEYYNGYYRKRSDLSKLMV
jgi:SAM-dependent methyltransferase